MINWFKNFKPISDWDLSASHCPIRVIKIYFVFLCVYNFWCSYQRMKGFHPVMPNSVYEIFQWHTLSDSLSTLDSTFAVLRHSSACARCISLKQIVSYIPGTYQLYNTCARALDKSTSNQAMYKQVYSMVCIPEKRGSVFFCFFLFFLSFPSSSTFFIRLLSLSVVL